MQPAHTLAERSPAPIAQSLAAGRYAWGRGRFDACLSALAEIPLPPPGEERVEYVLLMARAYLRTERPAEAVALLGPLADTLGDGDAVATARMLLGSALVRCGDVGPGTRLLDETAQVPGLHPTIAAEIDCYRALARRATEEYDLADELAQRCEAANADIISVRATQLRGFLALDRGRFPEAHRLFCRAADAYSRCVERDANLEANIVSKIAQIECETREAGFRGGHEERYRKPLPTVKGPAALVRVAFDGLAFALDGDAERATELAWAAERYAQSDPDRVYAIVGRAGISRLIGEPCAARRQAEHAAEIAEGIAWESTLRDERIALLTLADELSRHDVGRAEWAWNRYLALRTPVDSLIRYGASSVIAARERYVLGLMHRARGRYEDAHHALAEAASSFHAIGHLWRAALAWIEIAGTPGSEHRRSSALSAARLIARTHFPASFLVRMSEMAQDASEPSGPHLTPAEREVLRLAREGRGQREIAERMGCGYHTVRSHMQHIFRKFGVHSVPRLLAVCAERRIA